ncbi:MAG TPA: hypothetical protein VLN74_13070, partial [Ilumatobacteraceae bacterium]|nr:hypothetical protein [Ilumatobacteraceae bacterium]
APPPAHVVRRAATTSPAPSRASASAPSTVDAVASLPVRTRRGGAGGAGGVDEVVAALVGGALALALLGAGLVVAARRTT